MRSDGIYNSVTATITTVYGILYTLHSAPRHRIAIDFILKIQIVHGFSTKFGRINRNLLNLKTVFHFIL